MKIAIAGAGAMGSRFGIMLQKGGNEVLLIDGWKEHVDAIQTKGLQANFNGEDITVNIPIMLQSEVHSDEKMDVIILFTKAMQLEKMLQDITCMISKQTKVLCLLNGIGHEDVIEKFESYESQGKLHERLQSNKYKEMVKEFEEVKKRKAIEL